MSMWEDWEDWGNVDCYPDCYPDCVNLVNDEACKECYGGNKYVRLIGADEEFKAGG